MKTAITIIDTIQTGMDNYRDVRKTKIFNDESTIKEIKEWIIFQNKLKVDVDEISLATVEISDVI